MKHAVIRLPRWPGGARALTVRKAPRTPVPAPTPATAVPGQEKDSRGRLDAGEGHHRAGEQGQAAGQHGRGPAETTDATETAAPVPWTRKITSPPHERSDEPITRAASDGPKDR